MLKSLHDLACTLTLAKIDGHVSVSVSVEISTSQVILLPQCGSQWSNAMVVSIVFFCDMHLNNTGTLIVGVSIMILNSIDLLISFVVSASPIIG